MGWQLSFRGQASSIAIGLAGLLAASMSAAQGYPNRAVTLLTSIGAGSPTDIECRAVARFLQSSLKQTFVVEPRPGAGGAVAGAAVANAAPDGYTLFCSGAGPSTFKVLMKDLTFDPLRDLLPIAQFAEYVSVYATGSQSGFKSMDELVAYAKAHPGKLNYASYGRNSTVLAFEAMNKTLGISMTEIAYQGTPQGLQAALANDVQLFVAPIQFIKAQIDAGNIRPLIVIGKTKSVLYPNVPTFTDLGLDIPTGTWSALFAPGKTPRPVAERLANAIADYTQSDEVKAREKSGLMLFPASTHDDFRRKFESESNRYAEIANSLGWKPQ